MKFNWFVPLDLFLLLFLCNKLWLGQQTFYLPLKKKTESPIRHPVSNQWLWNIFIFINQFLLWTLIWIIIVTIPDSMSNDDLIIWKFILNAFCNFWLQWARIHSLLHCNYCCHHKTSSCLGTCMIYGLPNVLLICFSDAQS
jgi:hypothetical protein